MLSRSSFSLALVCACFESPLCALVSNASLTLILLHLCCHHHCVPRSSPLSPGNPKECKYAPSSRPATNLAAAFSTAERVYGLVPMMDPSDPYSTQCEQVSFEPIGIYIYIRGGDGRMLCGKGSPPPLLASICEPACCSGVRVYKIALLVDSETEGSIMFNVPALLFACFPWHARCRSFTWHPCTSRSRRSSTPSSCAPTFTSR